MNLRARLACLLPLILLGCGLVSPKPSDVPAPKARPTGLISPSEESRRLAAFYRAREARLVAQGKLRTDYAPADAPFGPDDLVRNFRRVALYDEYRSDQNELVAEQTVSQLRRWHKPLQIAIVFGDSVSPDQRRKDTDEVRSFARRLGAISGLRVNFTSVENANFVVTFLNRDEMLTEPRRLAADLPWMKSDVVRGIETLSPELYCVAFGMTSVTPPRGYVGAVVAIRAEHGPRLRKSCIQEEMTQALGLANDAPDIRPSIFNDDEEFALLTRHDEFLLKMLYDPRLRDGLTPDTELLILREVAQDAMKRSQI